MIYLDNAATTRVKDEVYEAMQPYFKELYGNPSSIYRFAGESRKAIEDSRAVVADFLNAKPEEIYFTGGGSESDNWALKAAAFARREKGKHIITSAIEHHAVLHTCEYLEKLGFEITYVGVDENGSIKLDELKAAIRKDTILITIMFANNEIGTIQPVKEIGELARQNGRSRRLSNNANFSFRFIEGESLLILLDQKDIAASSGSACTSGSLDPSHVLLAIGLPHETAHGSLTIRGMWERSRTPVASGQWETRNAAIL